MSATTDPTLLDLLDLQPAGENTWLAPTPSPRSPHVAGAQLLAQALYAACQTVTDGRAPHVIQVHFLHAVMRDEALELFVEQTRDGRSFATRTVIGRQAGKTSFSMVAAFHVQEAGYEWQEALAEATPPGAEEPYPENSPNVNTVGPFLVRRTAADNDYESWVRLIDPFPEDRGLQSCALVYAADSATVRAGMAQGHPPIGYPMSLNTSIWIHRPINMNDWHIIRGWPVSNADARGLAFASMHAADGRHVASIAHELTLHQA